MNVGFELCADDADFYLVALGHAQISSVPTSERPQLSANASLCNCGRMSQAASRGMDVCRIASAAATQELNALRLRFLGKAFEAASRKLDGLHFVRELRQAGKGG